MKNRTFKHDIIIILIIAVLIISLFLLNHNQTGHIVRITINQKKYGIYDLNENQTININNENILIIENNEIYMDKATCPDKTCIKQGHISQTGESIICLPHQLIAEVVNGEDGDLDGKSY